MVTALTAAERETVVNLNDEDDVVRIWTCRRRDITRLDKLFGEFLVSTKEYENGLRECRYEVPIEDFRFARRRTRQLTESERAALAERARNIFHGKG